MFLSFVPRFVRLAGFSEQLQKLLVGVEFGLKLLMLNISGAINFRCVFSTLFKVTFLVHTTVHAFTEQVTFSKVPENTAMFKWSPCI